MIRRVLVANRGEIAVRVVRACRFLGIQSVAAYSEADRDSLHVALADDAVCIGPAPANRSYLNISALIIAARLSDCDAIHPGYGFLSENAEFAAQCEAAGLIFIGPTEEHIRLMGDKARARQAARDAGIPIIEGSGGANSDPSDFARHSSRVGFPVLIKAAAGGGGRGMWRVESADELPAAIQRAQREATAAFGNGSVYVEKYVSNARHVEVQVLGDQAGKVVHFGERDCSLQRRHQKLLEESPCTVISDDLRAKLCCAAVSLAERCRYRGAGTIEFIVDLDEQRFYFIEMNTRIQVEHPVTEMVSGIDLVAAQIRIASGEPLAWRQDDVSFAGHAIECRINAEQPEANFAPSPGVLTRFVGPGGPFTRCDTHCFGGYEIPPNYDSLMAKVITHGRDRDEAVARMKSALSDFQISGVHTTIPLHQALLNNSDFLRSAYSTTWMEQNFLPQYTSQKQSDQIVKV